MAGCGNRMASCIKASLPASPPPCHPKEYCIECCRTACCTAVASPAAGGSYGPLYNTAPASSASYLLKLPSGSKPASLREHSTIASSRVCTLESARYDTIKRSEKDPGFESLGSRNMLSVCVRKDLNSEITCVRKLCTFYVHKLPRILGSQTCNFVARGGGRSRRRPLSRPCSRPLPSHFRATAPRAIDG